MFSTDTSDITFTSGSRLLSQSPLLPSSSSSLSHAHTGPGGDDLLLSELSLADQAAKTRDEKLQRDLFILKKLNSSFAAFNEVLKDTQTGTEVRFTFIHVLWPYLTWYTARCRTTSKHECLTG